MFPLIIYTRKRIFRHYTGFAFFLFIWISHQEENKARLIRHERIHYRQQLELLFILHWLLYGLFYIVSRLKGHEHYIAYRYNPFEMEAYDHDQDEKYLAGRKAYAWLQYMRRYNKILKGEIRMKMPYQKKIGWPEDGTAF